MTENKIPIIPNYTTENLNYLLVKVHSLILSADSLKIPAEEIKISGFSLVDWACDISEKIESIKYRDKKRELTNIEKQLNSLLSDDKQTELQIDSLESLLKS